MRVDATTRLVTLAEVNTDRAALTIWNLATTPLFIKFGEGCNIEPGHEDFSVKIPQNWYENIHWGENYNGVITGKWSAEDATGYAMVTEVNR